MNTAKALAVIYKKNLPAPFILAKGKGELAERIIKIAEEKGIEIVRNQELTERLFYLETGDFIPEGCYEIIAEILAFIYKIRMER